MRRSARLAGEELARSVGVRGFYCLDGLLGPEGFVATELNPRQASGLGLRAAWPDFPDYLFARAVQEQLDGVYDLPPEVVEREIREAVAATPSFDLALPGASTSLTLIDHAREDGALGLAVAALARRHDGAPWVSFEA